MNRPNQVVPSFVSVYLSADQAIVAGTQTTILFDIIDTDGTDSTIYNRTTGLFTAPFSAWYDLEIELRQSTPPADLLIIKNSDTAFPIASKIAATATTYLKHRVKLGLGETLQVDITAAAGTTVQALAGTTPDSRTTNVIFTMVKRFDDTKTF